MNIFETEVLCSQQHLPYHPNKPDKHKDIILHKFPTTKKKKKIFDIWNTFSQMIF
eukprot:m.47447 g.47447  ORF g.47447 m.47447 type:complete len:55 (+) comp10766_c0_seq3:3539-3703(+)